MNTFIQPGAPASLRASGKAATRARVLEAARRSLERVGYEATSVRDVARAAGVAAGTVLLHFTDKRDLLHAAFHDALAETARDALGGAPRRGRLDARLGHVAETFFAFYAARPALSRALLRESLFAEPPWSARFAAQVGTLSAALVTFVDEAKRAGELAADVDAQVLVGAFFSFYYFALLAWLQGGHPDPARLFRGLLAQHLGAAGQAAPAPRPKSRAARPTTRRSP